MEEEKSEHADPQKRYTAQTKSHCLLTNRMNNTSYCDTKPYQQLQKYVPASKTYGDVSVSGDARVQLGDVYIYNVHTFKEKSPSVEATPSWRHIEQARKPLVAATKSSRSEQSLLPWLLKMTYEQLNVSSERQENSRQSFQFDVLQKWRLHLSYATGWDIGLRIYPPRLHNVVPKSAPIMLASRKGDLPTIRDVLLEKQASTTDVTPDNYSPLFFAIEGGHSHIVKELLNAGADPNQVIGVNRTSPLQWAVHHRNEANIRLLIEYGASLEHVSRPGRSVLSYLWISEEDVQPSCIDLLHLLRTADSAEFRHSHQVLIDVFGFSTINRVACMGTHDEIEFLLQDGADIKSLVPLDWDAMFNATHQGSLRNVQVLAPYYPGFATRRDLRGWTLLHIAAGEGHTDIARYLLENGAEWQANSWPSDKYVDETLKGKMCTPAEVAEAVCPEYERLFLRVVEDVFGCRPLAAVETNEESASINRGS